MASRRRTRGAACKAWSELWILGPTSPPPPPPTWLLEKPARATLAPRPLTSFARCQVRCDSCQRREERRSQRLTSHASSCCSGAAAACDQGENQCCPPPPPPPPHTHISACCPCPPARRHAASFRRVSLRRCAVGAACRCQRRRRFDNGRCRRRRSLGCGCTRRVPGWRGPCRRGSACWAGCRPPARLAGRLPARLHPPVPEPR